MRHRYIKCDRQRAGMNGGNRKDARGGFCPRARAPLGGTGRRVPPNAVRHSIPLSLVKRSRGRLFSRYPENNGRPHFATPPRGDRASRRYGSPAPVRPPTPKSPHLDKTGTNTGLELSFKTGMQQGCEPTSFLYKPFDASTHPDRT